MQIKNKILSAVKDLKKYWSVPPKGRYMTFKEIVSLSVGGIGVKFIVYCVSNMIIAVGNTLIGNTIGIDPSAMYVIYILSILSSFPLTALRAGMIDNTRSMKGKYRPYILSMGIPTVLLGIGFVWMPYERMTLLTKCVVVLLFNIGFQFFYNFMVDAYDSLINVLSPNTIERSDVCSIKAVVENISPSIASIFLPVIAKLITGDNTLYDMRVYRVLYPPMLLVGLFISILVYVNTEEKIVQAKTHFVQIRFTDALRAVAKNKYFWIISLAGWIGFLESAFNSILGWMYNYQQACSPGQYSLIVAIAGNASFWPNLVAPYFIRKYGKKKILIFTNILNIGFILLMLPIVKQSGSKNAIWLLLFCVFINQFITSLGHLMNPSLNADIRDYQQYVTGERIDGMFAAVGLIGNIINLVTGFVLPAIYEKSGLNRSVALSLGYDGSNVYDVLFNSEYFVKISSVLILASAVGALLNVIPFFFYDLTETKQKAMVRVLRIRALFEDYADNVFNKKSVEEALGIIKEAEAYYGRDKNILSKEKIKAAKKSRDKELIKAEKADYRLKTEENEKIEIAEYVMGELCRYNTDDGKKELADAEKIVKAGIDNYYSIEAFSLKYAKKLPKSTNEEKEYRKKAVSLAKEIKLAAETAKKYFPDGIKVFDSAVFEVLFEREDSNALQINDVIHQMKTAKEANDREKVKALKAVLDELYGEKRQIAAEIKKATKENSYYNRAAKPYIDAEKTLARQKAYADIDRITEYCESKLKAVSDC